MVTIRTMTFLPGSDSFVKFMMCHLIAQSIQAFRLDFRTLMANACVCNRAVLMTLVIIWHSSGQKAVGVESTLRSINVVSTVKIKENISEEISTQFSLCCVL